MLRPVQVGSLPSAPAVSGLEPDAGSSAPVGWEPALGPSPHTPSRPRPPASVLFGGMRRAVAATLIAAAAGLTCLAGAPLSAQAQGAPQVEQAQVNTLQATKDPRLTARVLSRRPVVYQAGADPTLDRPAFVRAASGVVPFGERLAVVQDDAHFIALVDPRTGLAESVTLPPGADGKRIFEDARKNKKLKFDLESAAVVSTPGGPLLIALGSGSAPARETIVLLRQGAAGPEATVYPASRLYAALRALKDFSGSEMNLEGLVAIPGGKGQGTTLRVFQRGNGAARDGLQPVNAAIDLSLDALLAYLEAPDTAPLPRLQAPVRHELGTLGGVRLSFSDATLRGDDVLFLAASEDSPDAVQDGTVAGSALGVWSPGGTVRWVQLFDADGKVMTAKPEGLCLDPQDPRRLWLVTDPDDPGKAAELIELELDGPWTGG